MANNIMVERETFESHGKEYYSYFIKGVDLGNQIKIKKNSYRNGFQLGLNTAERMDLDYNFL